MRRQPKTIWNIAANVAGIIVNMVSGLLVMPYLVPKARQHHLWLVDPDRHSNRVLRRLGS